MEIKELLPQEQEARLVQYMNDLDELMAGMHMKLLHSRSIREEWFQWHNRWKENNLNPSSRALSA